MTKAHGHASYRPPSAFGVEVAGFQERLPQTMRRPKMRIDLHVHVADVARLLNDKPTCRATHSTGYLSRLLRRVSSDYPAADGAKQTNAQWLEQLAAWVRESPLDAIVVLALDAVYDEEGRIRPDRTVIHVENDFVHRTAKEWPEFIFGASIHPYRKDAVTEFERLVKMGTQLIKWIPSAQYIEPDSPRCNTLYEAMAHHGIPLLCHTGVEHMLGSRRTDFNHPRRLIPALQRGVHVIAAHCGTRLFLHEPTFVHAWALLAREYEHLYGDTGACSIVTRVPALRRILQDNTLQQKLLYGSDFPGIPSPSWCWQLGFSRMRELSRMGNPLTRNISVMRALGLPEEAFERAHKDLGIRKGIMK